MLEVEKKRASAAVAGVFALGRNCKAKNGNLFLISLNRLVVCHVCLFVFFLYVSGTRAPFVSRLAPVELDCVEVCVSGKSQTFLLLTTYNFVMDFGFN